MAGARHLGAAVLASLLAATVVPGFPSAYLHAAPPAPQHGEVLEQLISGAAGYWHAAGYTGSGVKVGIIGSFSAATLAAQAAAGEISAVPNSRRMCRSAGVSCTFGAGADPRDNGAVEVLSDVAPGATVYLAEARLTSDYYPVVDWMAAQGVTILVNANFVAYDGPGNGTGAAALVVDHAAALGMTWFNGAGELAPGASTQYAGSYWRGTWYDPNNNGWLNFARTDETVSAKCGALMGLRWSDWYTAAKTDYDLYIADFRASTGTTGTAVLASGYAQTAGAAPIEANDMRNLCNTNAAAGAVYDTNHDGFVSIKVKRKGGGSPSGDVIELAVLGGLLEYSARAGSVAIPFADSANPAEVTVGAMGQYGLYDHTSTSAGTTNDGRIKPDVVETYCVPVSVTSTRSCAAGTYFGSAAATSLAAALAAVAASAIHFDSPAGLARYVRDNASAPLGFNRPDATYGWGRFALVTSPPPREYVPSRFLALATPQRVVETRAAFGGPVGVDAAGPLAPGRTVTVPVTSWPTLAVAVVLNVAVVQATNDGYLSVLPHGWSYAGATSSLNIEKGQTRSNTIIVPVYQYTDYLPGLIDVYSSGGGDLIVDVLGHMVPDSSLGQASPTSGAGRYRPFGPARIYDSRTCIGIQQCTGQQVPAESFVDITISGQADPGDGSIVVPPDATAAVVSVTADTPAAAGFLSVLPGGQQSVTTSNLNYLAGKNATTLALVSLSGTPSGTIRVFTRQTSHVQVDLLGWFTAATGASNRLGMFQALAPARVLDTRLPQGSPPLAANTPTDIDLTTLGVPSDAIAAVINNVAVQPVAAGQLQTTATAPAIPFLTRALSMSAGDKAIATSTITGLADGGYVMRSSSTTHVVTDLSGYFLRGEPAAPAGSVTKVTEAYDGTDANGTSRLVGMSDDGNTVVFTSKATNLLDAAGTTARAYIWHRGAGSLAPFPYTFDEIALSGDGSTIAIRTTDHVVPGDTDAAPDLYLYDVGTGAVERVAPPQSYAHDAQLSSNGRRVAYVANFNNQSGAYWLDRDTGVTTALGVVFIPNLAMNNAGTKLATGRHDFVPGVQVDTLGTAQTKKLTLAQAWTGFPRFAGISADGRWVTVLACDGNRTVEPCLVDMDTGAVAQLGGVWSYTPYHDWTIGPTGLGQLTDSGTEMLWVTMERRVLVRALPAGTYTIADSTWDGTPPNDTLLPKSFVFMSADGRFVGYTTLATNVLPGSTNAGNIYIVDRNEL